MDLGEPQTPAPPAREVSGDGSAQLAELLATLTSCASGRAPKELFDGLTAGVHQRFQLPGPSPAYAMCLDVQVSQGAILLRFLDPSGWVLWQTELRQGPPLSGPYGNQASV